ncbi:MAG: STAS domain-containing protein [Lachnospiraceae bacterium]|nr:STAS domain-containing protein [Lachnospiraceae bacterium]
MHKIKNRYFDKDYKLTDVFRDMLAGAVVGLISIPISMGYAQVAGIPMVYGLYGSLLPILAFALISTTKNFVFGVDAAPAALVAGTLATLGITAESYGASLVVPMMAFLVSLWLFFFFFIKAGKIVQYISMPVMGGFVTGICCTVILMQLPKLFGGSAGVGEIIHLIIHISEESTRFHPLSFALGIGTLIILTISKKLVSKFPMPIVMMVVGIWITKSFHVDEMGVKLLPHVDPGLPTPVFHTVTWQMVSDLIFPSLVIAIVILAETLLGSKGVALKDGYKINNNTEVLAYAVGNFISALFGCLPVNGSLSRTGMARQFGAKSQVMSVTASGMMALILIFGTGYIEYMPVPVLTAIVISALLGACEFDLMVKLWKTGRVECYIFLSAFFGVLLFGTIYGVVIGMLLSFIMVIIRAVIPPRAFLGVIPERPGFYDLKRYHAARSISETIIYRFSGNLFFANIDTFQGDIEGAIGENTKQVIVNAAGITQIDVTAADRLLLLKNNLEKRGIAFYLTEHIGKINDQLRVYGAEELLVDGNIRRTVELALRACGINTPYPLENTGSDNAKDISERGLLVDAELEWIFGDKTDEIKEQLINEIIDKLKELPKGSVVDVETLLNVEEHTSWGKMGLLDEDDILERLETELTRMQVEDEDKRRTLEYALEERKEQIADHLYKVNDKKLRLIEKRRLSYEMKLKEKDPQTYELLIRMRRSHIEQVDKIDPKLAKHLRKRYNIVNGDEHMESAY